MSFASTDKVAALYTNGVLSDTQEVAAQIMLDWVEARILRNYPTVLAADANVTALVEQIEVFAVLRVLRNPSGLKQFQGSLDDGSESGTLDSVLSSGQLYITDEEMAELDEAVTGWANTAFSIRPQYTPDCFVEWPRSNTWY